MSHSLTEEILKELDERDGEGNFVFDAIGPEHYKRIRAFLLSSLTRVSEEAVKEERRAWLKGYRCDLCGKPMEPHPTTNTCQDCWENF
jgi:hypothetical protein